jgi:ELWxxDGT repeat protein
MVKDVCPGSCNNYGVHHRAFNGKVYYSGSDHTGNIGVEPWVSDGTDAGTHLLTDINPDPNGSSYPTDFTPVNGKLVFFAKTHDNESFSLWSTDGTANGTIQIATPHANPNLTTENIFIPYQNKLYFFVQGDAPATAHISDLWMTDGTANGTQMLKADIGFGDNRYVWYGEANGRLYIHTGLHYWVTDGTEAGTDTFSIYSNNDNYATVFQNKLYLHGTFNISGNSYSGLYQYDGVNMNLIMTSVSFPGGMFVAGNKLFIVELDDLWVSDGTPIGTKKLTLPGAYNRWYKPIVFDSKLYFSISAGGTNIKYLCATDGTDQGTQIIDTTHSVGINTSLFNEWKQFFSFGGKLYYEAAPIYYTDNVRTADAFQLYSSDGTSGGTKPVGNITTRNTNMETAVIGNELFLHADDGIHGTELWKITDFPTSVSSTPLSGENFTLYPNPAQDNIALQLPSDDKHNYRILNLYGQAIQHGETASGYNIAIAELPTGIYMLSVQLGEQTVIKKFVKE